MYADNVIIMSVEADGLTGKYRVCGSDGSVLEDGFSTAAAARRWIADRSDLGDRRELHRLLDEIEIVRDRSVDLADRMAGEFVLRATMRQRRRMYALLQIEFGEIDGGGAHGQA